VLDVAENPDASQVGAWARRHQIRVLNVAGPRESKCPGIYQHALSFLREVLTGLQNRQGKQSGGASPA